MNNLLKKLIFLSVFCVGLSSCVQKTPSTVLAPSSTTGDQTTETSTSQTEAVHGVEILWKIPERDLDGFVLVYGYDPSKLDQRLVLKEQDIKVTEHPEWGKVYRYILRPVKKDETLYFTMESFLGDQISPPSPLQAIETQLIINEQNNKQVATEQ